MDDLYFLDYVGVAIALVHNQTRKIIRVNSQMVELTSYDRHEVEGMNLIDLFAEEDKNKLLDLFKLEPTRPDQNLSDINFLLRRKSRRKLSVSLSVRKLPDQPSSLVTIQDNTVIREAEWQLADAQSRLVEAAKFKALGEMAGGIAHEINNPLAIIAGLAETLNYLSQDGQIHQVADKITNTAHRISGIISGLKMISRDTSNDPHIPYHLHKIVEDTLEFCKERFRNNSVEIKVSPLPKDWIILGRPTQISQVILNLLNNAFDAVADLPEKWIHIDFDESDRFYRLLVRDSGQGIPKKIRKKIMEPFFTTKEVGSGTGLGLSISKGIVESHNGYLELVEQTPNTEFVINLPKPAANESVSPATPLTGRGPSRKNQISPSQVKALIVEDEADLRSLMVNQLERRGFQIVTAPDGQKALQILKEDSGINIVLSDVRMAEADGLWLLKQVNDLTNHTMPFIFVTGSLSLSIEEAYHLGAGAVFFKPVRFPALIDTILQMTTPRDQKWSQRLPRIDVELQVKIRLGLGDGQNASEENLINLGRGGMFVAMSEQLPKIGETVKFQFAGGAKNHQRIAGSGIVRWVRKEARDSQPAGFGIEFLYIEENCRGALLELINSICTYSYIPNQLD